jgi:hypothetical protein
MRRLVLVVICLIWLGMGASDVVRAPFGSLGFWVGAGLVTAGLLALSAELFALMKKTASERHDQPPDANLDC